MKRSRNNNNYLFLNTWITFKLVSNCRHGVLNNSSLPAFAQRTRARDRKIRHISPAAYSPAMRFDKDKRRIINSSIGRDNTIIYMPLACILPPLLVTLSRLQLAPSLPSTNSSPSRWIESPPTANSSSEVYSSLSSDSSRIAAICWLSADFGRVPIGVSGDEDGV